MAKQKRANKGLIAFVTFMGVVVVVSVAALVIHQRTQRDPEVLARNAQQLEEKGDPDDLERAAALYRQAFARSQEKETRYLLDVARIAYKLAVLPDWIGTLKRVNSRSPDDPAPLVSILDGLWALRTLTGQGLWWNEWRDNSGLLLQIDLKNPISDEQRALALASRAMGLWNVGLAQEEGAMSDPQDLVDKWGRTGDEAIAKAYELYPENPYVAITYAENLRRGIERELENARAANARVADLEQIAARFIPQALEALRPAVAKNGSNVLLAMSFSEYARRQAAAFHAAQKPDDAATVLAEATKVLDAAAEANPDNADVHFARGRLLADELSRHYREKRYAEAAALRPKIIEAATKANDLDPATFQAYLLRADMILLPADPSADSEADRVKRLEEALALLEEARDRTLALKSLRATVSQGARQLLLFRGFLTALGYYDETRASNEEQARVTRTRAQTFLEDARARNPQSPITHYMDGTMRVLDNDSIAAIKSFEQAHESAKTLAGSEAAEAQFWLIEVRAGTLPTERLASLYRGGGELGEALNYARVALMQYEGGLQQNPPARLAMETAELLLQLQQPRAAADLLQRYQETAASQPNFAALYARVLTALGRGDEAKTVLEQAPSAPAGGELMPQIWRAQEALSAEDYANANQLARPVALDPNATDPMIQAALQVVAAAAEATGDRAGGAAFVGEVAAKQPREKLKQLYRSYQIVLGETDPAKRESELLKLIAETPDPADRAQQEVNFFMGRNKPAEALSAIETLGRLRPDDLDVVATKFEVLVRLERYDEASALLPRIIQADEGRGYDRAGGATFRGRLALAQNQAELAIREFRQAATALPTSTVLQTSLAEAYMKGRRYAEAVEALQRALAANPRNVRAHALLVGAYDEQAEQATGDERDALRAQAEAAFEQLAALAPNNAYVAARREAASEIKEPRAAIEKRLARVASDPNDVRNIARVAELYTEAWRQANKARDERAKGEILQQGDTFFTQTVATLPPPQRVALTRFAIEFFAEAAQRDRGEKYLRTLLDGATDPADRVTYQVLLARFLELQGDLPEAERSYQLAQAMMRDFTLPDARQTEQVKFRVATELIDFYQRTGRPQEVVEACNWFINLVGEKHPDTADVRLKLVDALISARLLDDARREIEKYFEQFGSTTNGLAARARLNLMTRQTRDAAEDDLTAILQADPQNAWAKITRGWLYLRRARFNEAREDLLGARALVSTQSQLATRLYMLLGNYYEATRQPELAIESMRTYLTALEAAGAPETQVEQVVFELVRLLRESQKFEEAQREVSLRMERQPNVARWPELLADALAERGDAALKRKDQTSATRDHTAAANYYARAAERYGDENLLGFSISYAKRLESLVKAGQAREALALFNQFPMSKISVRPPSIPEPVWPGYAARIRTELLPAVALAHGSVGDTDQARKFWGQALVDAATANYGLLRGVIDKMGETLSPGEIELILSAAVGSLPIDRQPGQLFRISLAEHLHRMSGLPDLPTEEMRERSRQLLDEVDKAAGANAFVLGALLLERAQLLDTVGDEPGAIAAYEQALRLDEHNRVALNNLAFKLVTARDPALRKPEAAVKLAERLEGLTEDDSNAASMFDTIGYVYYQYAISAKDRREFLARAEEMLRQSLVLRNEGNFDAHAHLALVYKELGRLSEARDLAMRGQTMARQRADEALQKRFDDLLQTLQ